VEHSLDDIATVFALPPMPGERRTAAETLDLGHGRIEQRGLRTSDMLMGYSDWPGLAHVFRLERQVTLTTTGAVRGAGHTNIAAACRRFAAQPRAALRLIGIALEN
jgi:hypothetical protein